MLKPEAAMGIRSDFQNDEENDYLKAVYKWVCIFKSTNPFLISIFTAFNIFKLNHVSWKHCKHL